ncbi:glutathione S-transferase family protein [Rhodovulum sp. DZ06]|uniref:glutathione S-transferase family protein n=1 Tax=Rhodovulum sp. DZ06 TaxID=3425126 RepID=UPI003D33A4E1
MGMLIDGEWTDQWYDTKSTGGRFKRSEAAFRNWVTADGAPGPTGEGGFKAESGRYHLYVSYACPWAHRTLVMRAIKGLEDHITVDAVHPDMLSDGWTFETNFDGAEGDSLFGSDFMREVYLRDTPDMTGRVTVPVLWDKRQGRIVSNESSEIIRMLDSAFAGIVGRGHDHYPEDLREEIDAVNAEVYDRVNNGVYKAGFATTQEAYEEAVHPLFETLEKLEARLGANRYLCGDRITEADWRLFTTMVRFDSVYHGHFKCSIKRLVDFPNLWAWTRELYQRPGVAATVRLDHIRRHYHYSHETINPNRIVPAAPEIDFTAPHGRSGMLAA